MKKAEGILKGVQWGLVMLTGIYILLRAIRVPFFSDEVSTFFRYVQIGQFNPFLHDANANNHPLNSLLMWFCYRLFGDGPLALRLPNVLAFFLYGYYVIKLGRLFKSPWLSLAWLVVMIGSHYVVSFFHLARGYGLSLAFLMMALYHLQALATAYSRKNLVFSLCGISLALWANLSLLTPGLALAGLSGLLLLLFHNKNRNRSAFLTDLGLGTVFGILPIAFAIKLALYLKKGGALYHGVDEGFVSVVINRFMMEVVPRDSDAGLYYFWPFFGVYVIGLGYLLFTGKWKNSYALQLILWLTVVGTILQHVLMDVFYPLDRAALHFFPLFATAFFFVLKELPRFLAVPLGAIPAVLLGIQQLDFYNYNRTSHWVHEHVPEDLYHRLLHWQDSTGIDPLISVHGLSGRTLVYHGLQNGNELNSPTFEFFPSRVADFVVSHPWVSFDTSGFRSFVTYPDLDILVYERMEHRDWIPVDSVSVERLDPDIASRTLGEFDLKGRHARAVAIEVSGVFQTETNLYRGWMALYHSDTLDQELGFYYLDMARMIPDLREGKRIHKRMLLDQLTGTEGHARLYILNVGESPYEVRDLKVRLSILPKKN